jgi:hypothetical protein
VSAPLQPSTHQHLDAELKVWSTRVFHSKE